MSSPIQNDSASFPPGIFRQREILEVDKVDIEMNGHGRKLFHPAGCLFRSRDGGHARRRQHR